MTLYLVREATEFSKCFRTSTPHILAFMFFKRARHSLAIRLKQYWVCNGMKEEWVRKMRFFSNLVIMLWCKRDYLNIQTEKKGAV